MKHPLSAYQTTAFAKLIQQVLQTASPEKIYLLAACTRRYYLQSIFKEPIATADAPVHYHLLVLSAENEMRDSNELQHSIESSCGIAGMVTAFVFPVQQFNTWLMHAHPFACKVYDAGLLCYDVGNIPLAIPDKVNDAENETQLRKQVQRCHTTASGFISAAELFTLRKQYPLAAFNLHQAAEQLLTCFIRITTGLQVHTHNLDKLYRYCLYSLTGLEEIFPRNTEQEKQIFQLLQKAYIDSRYKAGYTISLSEITLLHQRILQLLQLCPTMQTLTPHTF